MKIYSILTFVVTCLVAHACSEEGCLDLGGIDAVSLLQKSAKKSSSKELHSAYVEKAVHTKAADLVEDKTVLVKPSESIEDKAALAKLADPAATSQQIADGGIALPPTVTTFVNKFGKRWAWGDAFNNYSLIAGCILVVIYELCVNAGFRLDGFFDQETAGKWQYYSYGFYQYAVFGVCVPLSEPLSTALGFNPAWSGLLMTIMPAMEVPGIEIGRRLVMPFNQNFLVKWLCFGRLFMCASQGMWVIVLLTPSIVKDPSLCFWLLMLSRALLGLGSGMVNTPTTYMAVKWTSKERMKNMTSYATMAKRLGMSFGVITSSFTLEVFDMTAKDSTIEQMAALPVAFSMVTGLLMILIFDVSCTREQPPEKIEESSDSDKDKPKVEQIVVPTTEASLSRRASIVLNSIVYNFSGSMQRESIDLSAGMVFAGYGLSVTTIGYFIGLINFSAVVWIAGITEFMKKGGMLDPAHLMVYYSIACLFSGIFFFNVGGWVTFMIADCICFTATTAAIGISNGLATNAGIPDSHYSKDSFTAYRAQTTAGARFLAGPVARGAIYWTGRTGYGLVMAFFLCISYYNNWKTRDCFLDKSDGHSEEEAQMNGSKRGGI